MYSKFRERYVVPPGLWELKNNRQPRAYARGYEYFAPPELWELKNNREPRAYARGYEYFAPLGLWELKNNREPRAYARGYKYAAATRLGILVAERRCTRSPGACPEPVEGWSAA